MDVDDALDDVDDELDEYELEELRDQEWRAAHPVRAAVKDARYDLSVRVAGTRRRLHRAWLAVRYWWPLRHAGTLTTNGWIDPYTFIDVDGERCLAGRPVRGWHGWVVPILPVRR